MSTLVVVVKRPDGRLYPPEPLTDAERGRIRGLAHALSHRGMSQRQVQRALFDQHGIRRSIGAVHADLTAYECPLCADRPPPEPRPQRHPLGELAGAADALEVIRVIEPEPEPAPAPEPRTPPVARLSPAEQDTADWLAVIRDRAAGYSWSDLNEGSPERRRAILSEIMDGI